MKKYLVAAVLLVSSHVAMAEWVKQGTTKKENQDIITYYVDYSRSNKVNGGVSVWSMMNYSRPQAGGFRSVVLKQLFNCKDDTSKTLLMYYYKQENAKGAPEAVALDGTEIHHGIPNTPNGDIMTKVCSGELP